MDILDILDAQGIEPNFLNGSMHSEQYREVAKKWSALPMYTDGPVMDSLVASIKTNQVTLVVSGTGSGKTVIVPKVAARVLMSRVAVTNPKSSTTRANAEYAALCMDVPVGAEVGYHFRGSLASAKSAKTKLLYVTDGILLAQARRDPMLSEYGCIIIDEAHERPPPVDFLLQACIDIMRARPAFRLIIMSATIDANIFLDYFKVRDISTGAIFAKGVQSHEVRHVYLPHVGRGIPRDYFADGLAQLEEILSTSSQGDILWFVPTSADAVQGCRLFSSRKSQVASVLCTELFSKATADAKAAALTPPPDPYIRKVIFATNIAESSFTFPGLAYVIDSGLELQSSWDPARRCQVIRRAMASQAQLKQREGRVGRQGPGTVHHLYSEKARLALPEYPVARILAMDLTQEILSMLTHQNLGDVIRSCGNLLTPPSPGQVASAVSFLHYHDLVIIPPNLTYEDAKWHCREFQDVKDILEISDGGQLTPMGMAVHGLIVGAKVSPWNALITVHGAMCGLLDDSFNLAILLEELSADPASAMMLIDGRPLSTMDANMLARTRHGICEHVTLLNAMKHAADPLVDPDTFAAETGGLSHAFFNGAVQKASAKRMEEAKKAVSGWLQNDVLLQDASYAKWTQRIVRVQEILNASEKSKKSKKEEIKTLPSHPMIAPVIAARLYHYTVPRPSGYTLAFNPCIKNSRPIKVKPVIRTLERNPIESGVVEMFTDSGMDAMQATIFTPFEIDL